MNKLESKRVLISGITGFVGVNLNKYLNSTYEIFGISRKSDLQNRVLSYDDITLNEFNSFDSMIHLAGKAHDLKGVSKPEEYFEVNTDLTKRLFDLFLNSSCERFVYVSSVKAAADFVPDILTEDHLANPITPYGQSKLEAEKYILSKELPNNKKVYILRPCMIHGPGNKGNLNLLYKFISKGIPYPLGKYKNRRSFVSIDNLCFIIKELIEGEVNSGIYNVADNDSISTSELVYLIGKETGKVAKIWNIPIWFIEFISKMGNVLKLPLNSHRLDKLTENYEVSNKKILDAIKKELPISTIEGLKKTIKSF